MEDGMCVHPLPLLSWASWPAQISHDLFGLPLNKDRGESKVSIVSLIAS